MDACQIIVVAAFKSPSILKQQMSGHVDTQQCDEGGARRVQHESAATSMLTLEARLTAYCEELERVELLKYLRRLLAFDDNVTHAMRSKRPVAFGIRSHACFGRRMP